MGGQAVENLCSWVGAQGWLENLLQRVQGLEESAHCAPVLLALRELLNLHDLTLLGLEVASLRQQFPDVRCGGRGRGEEPERARVGLTHLVEFLQRGSRLCPLGPARGRVSRASPGSTQLAAGWPTSLTFHCPPGALQPGTNSYALSVLLPPLRPLLLTSICLRNKATSTAHLCVGARGC